MYTHIDIDFDFQLIMLLILSDCLIQRYVLCTTAVIEAWNIQFPLQ